MKKNLFSLGLIAVAAFTLTNCAQEIENPNQEQEVNGYPFEIVAKTVDTKTVNDGMSTIWADGDAINLFHQFASEDAEYVSDGEFKFDGENIFKGQLADDLIEESSYNWYAIYPYSSYYTTPTGEKNYMPVGSKKGAAQTQEGNNSLAHIAGANYPLAGVCEDWEYEAGVSVEIEMSHLTSLLEVVVNNTTEDPITVESVALTAPENLVGTYYLDFTGAEVVYTPSGDNFVSKTANLSVKNATALANGESAKYYLAVKPFTAAKDQKLTLSVNGYSKEITLSKDVTFTAGKIKTLNFAFDQEKVETPAISLPWSEDFSGDLSEYTVSNGNGGGTTKIYTENLAGGTAPEILIAKSNGSLSATIAAGGYVGALTLTFKSNYSERLSVTSPTEGVKLSKLTNTEYAVNVEEGVETFELKFTNTSSSNTRLDDILLVKGVQLTQTLTFETPSYSFYIGSDEAAAFTGQPLQGAHTQVVYSSNNTSVASVDANSGVVTLGDVEGTATITAKALATEEYKEATATYIIALNKKSEGGVAKQYTFTITKGDFNSTSYAANNNEKTSTATAEDGTTMDVKWTSNQVMNQNSTMQWKKNEGYIFNSTDLGTINDVTIESTAGSFTEYVGPALRPTANGEGGYFQIKVGNSTGKVTKITITFTK